MNKTGLIVDEDSSELVGFLKKTLRKPTDEDVPVKAPNRALATVILVPYLPFLNIDLSFENSSNADIPLGLGIQGSVGNFAFNQ